MHDLNEISSQTIQRTPDLQQSPSTQWDLTDITET